MKVWLARHLGEDEQYLHGVFASEQAAYDTVALEETEAVSEGRGTDAELNEDLERTLQYIAEALVVEKYDVRS